MKKPLPIVAGPNQTLAINPDGTVRAVGLNEGGGLNVGGWTDIVSLSSLKNFTVAVKRDGTVVCTGTYSDSWGPELDTLPPCIRTERSRISIAKAPESWTGQTLCRSAVDPAI